VMVTALYCFQNKMKSSLQSIRMGRALRTAMYDRRRMIALADTTEVSNRRSTPTRLPNENRFDGDISPVRL